MKLQTTKALKRSYWQESLPSSENAITHLASNIHADIAIIGGGFVGLWTALTIKQHEPDCVVVIVEQNICGGGASGRNGGFVMSWWPKIGTLNNLLGTEQAIFLGKQAEQAIYELSSFCEEHNIDAHFTQKGWLWTATTPLHLESWNSTLQTCKTLGVQPFEQISQEELIHRTGSNAHLAGIFEKSNATVQPFALVQGMKRVALEKGVIIYEQTPVLTISEQKPIILETPHGTIKTQKVVLATNAWSSAIPELAEIMTPVNSSIVMTKPLGTLFNEIGWIGGESITDSQLMVDYYRTTRDGRIAFGKGTGAISYQGNIENTIFSEDTPSITLTEKDFFRTYPSIKPDHITHRWSGPIDRTYDSLPILGHLKEHPSIYYSIGWSGNGVGPSRIGGRILASLALDRQDEWSQCGLINRTCRKFPVEPIRYVGGNLVRQAVIRKEAKEIQGKKPHQWDKFMAGFAPAGLEDKS